MQHHEHAGQLEVDHFDPRKKKELIQDYNNLFPVSRQCNGKKSNHWPSKAEEKAGCRFLNPCEEMDYGEQIFEDSVTHHLVGVTPAARWHIRICGLNGERLVAERTKRAEYWDLLNNKPMMAKTTLQEAGELIRKFKDLVKLMIPAIAPPPTS
jgi:hypothetical protein